MVTISLIKPEAKASTFSNESMGIQSSEAIRGQGLAEGLRTLADG